MLRLFRSLSSGEEVVGLDIGDGLITAAVVELRNGGGFHLTNAGWVEIDPTASVGEIGAAVQRLWHDRGITTYTVCSCLRSPSLLLRYFHYENLDRGELESALALEAEEMLQAPRPEVALDWHVNRIERNGNGQSSVEGVLVALPQAEVAAHLAILQAADLYPIIIDIGCMAVGNLFLASHAVAEGQATACVVNLTQRSADIALLFNGRGIYPRSVYAREEQWSDAAGYLAGNIDDVLKYCQFKLRQPAVPEVIVTGQIPPDEAFQSALREALSVPVTFWDPVVNARRSWRVTRLFQERPEKGSALAGCLGLALRR